MASRMAGAARNSNARLVSRRNFQSSSRVMDSVFGTPKEGPYSNIPFEVKRKFIPFKVYYWGILGFFFGFPFLSTYLNLKKSGSFM